MDPRSSDILVGHLPLLLNYIGRRLRYYEAIGDLGPDALTAEDVAKAVYLEAVRRRDQLPSGTEGYRRLRALADDLLERELRRVRAERASAENEPEVSLARRLPEMFPDPSTPPPDEVAAAAEMQRALARIVGDLPIELREPFLLRVGDRYDRDDVAAIEGISPDQVDRRVASASLLMRERLAREYGEREAPRLDELFRLIERLQPSAATQAFTRAQLDAASSPPPPTAA